MHQGKKNTEIITFELIQDTERKLSLAKLHQHPERNKITTKNKDKNGKYEKQFVLDQKLEAASER